MKKCSKCNTLKPETDFSLHYPRKDKTKLRPDCKECVRNRQNRGEDFSARMKILKDESKKSAREFIDNYLSTRCCVDCGISDKRVLDFDHVRGDKYSDISTLVARGARLWRIEEEIAKCEVRCANCHRIITHQRRLNIH